MDDHNLMGQHWVPLEILIEVLQFLGIKDAIRCKLVCKAWKSALENYVLFREISLFVNCPRQSNLMRLPNHYLTHENSLYFSDRKIFDCDLSTRLQNLRILYFCEFYYDSNKYARHFTKLINSFKNLEHLELKLLILNVHLIKLPVLRSLAISNKLDTIKVKNVVCPNLTQFSFQLIDNGNKNYFLPKVKKLICIQFEDWMQRLANLETLIVGKLVEKDQHLLKCFKKLKYLDVYQITQPVLKAIELHQEKLDRSQLKIYFRGLSIQIPDIKWVLRNRRFLESSPDSYKNFYRTGSVIHNPINLYAQNLDRTAERLHFFEDIYIEDNHGLIDRCFFRKLHEVSFITILANSLTEPEILKILQNFKILKSLCFEEVTNVTGCFFDKLPSVCPYLHTLHIKENCRIDIENFEFLYHFKELHSFTINCASLSAKEKTDLNERLDSHTKLQSFPFKKSSFNHQSIMLLLKS